MELTPRFFKVPAGHFFLLGPRGTGKTSWTQQQFPDALRVDLLDPGTLRLMAAQPERLREQLGAMPGTKTVIIDEVQKLPELLEVVHGLIEEKTGVRFVLTGSSARKLRRGGVNLLGGRATSSTMHPFLAAELGEGFDPADVVGLPDWRGFFLEEADVLVIGEDIHESARNADGSRRVAPGSLSKFYRARGAASAFD